MVKKTRMIQMKVVKMKVIQIMLRLVVVEDKEEGEDDETSL